MNGNKNTCVQNRVYFIVFTVRSSKNVTVPLHIALHKTFTINIVNSVSDPLSIALCQALTTNTVNSGSDPLSADYSSLPCHQD
jgi:hypothetical protein